MIMLLQLVGLLLGTTADSPITYTLYNTLNPDGLAISRNNYVPPPVGTPPPEVQLKVLLHSVNTDATDVWVRDLTREYRALSTTAVEVFVLTVNIPNLRPLVSIPKLAGWAAQIAEIVAGLAASATITMDRVHFVGHGVGAHIAGQIARRLYELNRPLTTKVSRITGLNPAGAVSFVGIFDPSLALNRNDAAMVDVIHTETVFTGTARNLGDADFIVNGGKVQPGCSFFNAYCSDYRSTTLFIDSVKNNDKYLAKQCYSLYAFESGQCGLEDSLMGNTLSTPLPKGTYYINTNSRPPYYIV